MGDKNYVATEEPIPLSHESLMGEVRYLDELAKKVALEQHALIDKTTAISLRLQLLHRKLREEK